MGVEAVYGGRSANNVEDGPGQAATALSRWPCRRVGRSSCATFRRHGDCLQFGAGRAPGAGPRWAVRHLMKVERSRSERTVIITAASAALSGVSINRPLWMVQSQTCERILADRQSIGIRSLLCRSPVLRHLGVRLMSLLIGEVHRDSLIRCLDLILSEVV